MKQKKSLNSFKNVKFSKRVRYNSVGIYHIEGSKGIYAVDTINRSCTCPHFYYTKTECYHLKECDKLERGKKNVRNKIN